MQTTRPPRRPRCALLLVLALGMLFVTWPAVGRASSNGPPLPQCQAWQIAAWDQSYFFASPDFEHDGVLFSSLGQPPGHADSSATFWRSTDRGLTWTAVNTQAAPDDQLVYSLNYATDHTIVIPNGLYRSTDSGDTWAPLPLPPVGSPHRVAVPGREKLFAAALDFPPGMGGSGLYYTADAGNTWNLLNPASLCEVVVSPAFATGQTLLIHPCAYHWDGGLRKSVDGGHTWQDASNGFASDLFGYTNLVAVFSPAYQVDQTIFSTGSDGLYISTNAGAHWAPLGPRAANYTGGLLVVSPRYAVDRLLWWQAGGPYISTDGGATWRTTPLLPGTAGTVCVPGGYCRTQLIGAARDSDGEQYAYKSFDGGQSWRCLEDPYFPPPPKVWLPLVAMRTN